MLDSHGYFFIGHLQQPLFSDIISVSAGAGVFVALAFFYATFCDFLSTLFNDLDCQEDRPNIAFIPFREFSFSVGLA